MTGESSAYVDASGRPRLRESITGFLDVLGFSQISTSATTLEQSQHILDQIATAISRSRACVRDTFKGSPFASPDCWALRFFSDNLSFGIPIDSDRASEAEAALFGVRCAQHYQLHMALNHLFVRGALTVGPICLTDEIIFGSALIECYRLETVASIVPRVLITDPLKEILSGRVMSSGSASADTGNDLCRDIDGRWFVNYLQAAVDSHGVDWQQIEQHKASVLDSLSSTTAHNVLPKYGWSCRYHNIFCHWHRSDPGYSDRYRIDRIDEQSTIYRLADLPERTSPP